VTGQQRRKLERRARAEGRLVANYVSAIVVRELGKGETRLLRYLMQ
jgi:hypothetical protein